MGIMASSWSVRLHLINLVRWKRVKRPWTNSAPLTHCVTRETRYFLSPCTVQNKQGSHGPQTPPPLLPTTPTARSSPVRPLAATDIHTLCDKIASVHFIREIYLYFSIGNGQLSERALCQLYRHTFVPYSDGSVTHRKIVCLYIDHTLSPLYAVLIPWCGGMAGNWECEASTCYCCDCILFAIYF